LCYVKKPEEALYWKEYLSCFEPEEALLKKNTWVVELGEACSKNTREDSECINLLK